MVGCVAFQAHLILCPFDFDGALKCNAPYHPENVVLEEGTGTKLERRDALEKN